jgi:hypothetical protein
MDKCKSDAFSYCAKESRSKMGNDPTDTDAEYDPVYREECIERLNQKCAERNSGGRKKSKSKKGKSKKGKSKKGKKTRKNRK